MPHYHAVVWIDHHKASSWQFTATEQEGRSFKAQNQHDHVHTGKSQHGGHRAAGDHEFFESIAKSLAGSHEVLVLGPAQTKLEFVKYLEDKHPQLAKSIVAVETADHPSEGQLLAHARKYFDVSDRMRA